MYSRQGIDRREDQGSLEPSVGSEQIRSLFDSPSFQQERLPRSNLYEPKGTAHRRLRHGQSNFTFHPFHVSRIFTVETSHIPYVYAFKTSRSSRIFIFHDSCFIRHISNFHDSRVTTASHNTPSRGTAHVCLVKSINSFGFYYM